MHFQHLTLAALLACALAAPAAKSSRATVPGAGTTFFNVGQNYADEWSGFASGAGVTPAGISVYGDIFSGTLNPDSQSLLPTYAGAHNGYVEVGMSWKDAMTSNGYTQYQGAQLCNDIAGGKYDSQLQSLAKYLGGFSVSYLFRVDYEVSGNLHANTDATAFDPSTWDTAAYPKAFAHVRQVMAAAAPQADIAYVYHAVRGEGPLLYPGDDVVDYNGFSVFNNDVCMPVGPTANCDGSTLDPNLASDLAWAPKPKLVAESAVQPPAAGDSADFVTYLTRVAALVDQYDVRGWTYINSDWLAHGWDAQTWGDSRIEQNPDVLSWWQANVKGNARYTFGS